MWRFEFFELENLLAIYDINFFILINQDYVHTLDEDYLFRFDVYFVSFDDRFEKVGFIRKGLGSEYFKFDHLPNKIFPIKNQKFASK